MKKTNKTELTETSAAAKAAVIKLGQDVHAAMVVVVVQLDGCPPQPPQRIATAQYVDWVQRLKAQHAAARVVSCYEAGPCGYWLHRALVGAGVENHVVAPVALNGRRKTDARDARALGEMLDRYVRGNRHAFSPVAVPTPEQEQDRALLRHRQQLLKSLGRCAQQGRSLMLTQGRRERGPWWSPKAWARLRPTLPAWMAALLDHLQAQARLLHEQLAAVSAQIAELARAKKVQAPRGIGALTWMTLLLEMLDWARFHNRRQVASYTGLCPGEHSSGARRLELSIDKHGNRRVRHVLIEAAWRLLLWQPDYPPLHRLRAARGARARKRAVVAVARHLAIDLWRLATGRTTPEQVGLNACDTRLCQASAA